MKYFLYTRKSTESEDRQILSLPAQKRELLDYAQKNKFDVVGMYSESASAYKIGRSQFNEMVQKIHDGEADGIIVWALNRLARNALDGGMIVHLMDIGKLKEIRTPSNLVKADGSNKFMLQIEFAMSKKSSDDNSESVKRGNREKILRGWDIRKHIGYKYIEDEKTTEKVLIPDEERFSLLQKAVYQVLKYKPVFEVVETLNNDWGFRTPKTRKQGNRPISLSNFYNLLHSEFYCGWIYTDDGQKIKGNHQPMLSDDDFDRVQEVLGSKGKPRKSSLHLPFRGQIYCGECGCMACLDEKKQIICTRCKTKFSSKHRDDCVNCGLKIDKMVNPSRLHHIYCRCTKKKHSANCTQKSLRLDKLQKQLSEYLGSIYLSPKVDEWVLKQLSQTTEKEFKTRDQVRQNLQKELNQTQKRLDSLLASYTSPDNLEHDLVSPDEYRSQKGRELANRKIVEDKIKDLSKQSDTFMSTAEIVFNFALTAKERFDTGSYEVKTEIIQDLGSNLILKDGIISVKHEYPWLFMSKTNKKLEELKNLGLEPEKCIDMYEQTGVINPIISTLQGRRESNPY